MATFTAETDTAFTKLVYTAVPLDKAVFSTLAGHSIKERLHRWNSTEVEDVEAFWGFVNGDDPITFSLSRYMKEVTESAQYDKPRRWPPKHTSLQVGATGRSEEGVEQVVDEILGRWNCVELHMREHLRPHYHQGMKAFLSHYELDHLNIGKMNEARAMLSDAVEIPNVILPDSHYIKNQMMTYPTFFGQPALPASVQMMLIDRVKGKVGDRDVELGLLYMNANNVLGTYGVFAFTTGQIHPKLGEEVRSCAGYLFGTGFLHVGGVVHIEEANTVVQMTDHIHASQYKSDSIANSKVKSLDVPEMKALAELFIS